MFTNSFLAGLGMIIGTAIGAIIYAMLARVWMELIIVLFRIAENTTELVRQGHLRPQA
jgi:large-conductance mechanosensitive channel